MLGLMTTSTKASRDDAAFRVAATEPIPRAAIVHHVDDDGAIYFTAFRTVYRLVGGQAERLGQFPFVAPRDFFGFHRLAQRAARADKCNLYPARGGAILAIRGGTAYRLAGGQMRRLFAINGDCVLHRGICEDPDGAIYFGEYFMNPGRGPVRIWRVGPDLDAWEVAWEFPAGSTRHVHGVFRDPYEPDALWATLGDYAGESWLVKTTDRFRTITRYGDGSQRWRAVTLFFTPSHVCWLTDSHLEQNVACRMSRDTVVLETGQAIDSSTWYGTTTVDGLHVAFTSVERGPAVQTRHASVLVSRDAFHWTKALDFKKDIYRPVRLFKYGVISCPSGAMHSSRVILSGEGLVGLDGRSLAIEIVATEPAASRPSAPHFLCRSARDPYEASVP